MINSNELVSKPIMIDENEILNLIKSPYKNKIYLYIRNYINLSPNRYIPDCYDFQRRNEFTHKVSWAIPTSNVIYKIIEFSDNKQIVEVAAGHGLWASLIKRFNKDIIATDNFSTHGSKNLKTYTTVFNMDAETTVDKYLSKTDAVNSVLMIIWPLYSNSLAVDTLYI